MIELKKIKKLENISIKIYIAFVFIITFCLFIKREIFINNDYFYILELWTRFHFCLFFIYNLIKKVIVKKRLKK